MHLQRSLVQSIFLFFVHLIYPVYYNRIQFYLDIFRAKQVGMTLYELSIEILCKRDHNIIATANIINAAV